GEYVHPKHLLGSDEDRYWYLRWIAAGTTVLDVGCGHGMHALKAARRCRQVIGLDADRPALGIAPRVAPPDRTANPPFLAPDAGHLWRRTWSRRCPCGAAGPTPCCVSMCSSMSMLVIGCFARCAPRCGPAARCCSPSRIGRLRGSAGSNARGSSPTPIPITRS